MCISNNKVFLLKYLKKLLKFENSFLFFVTHKQVDNTSLQTLAYIVKDLSFQ